MPDREKRRAQSWFPIRAWGAGTVLVAGLCLAACGGSSTPTSSGTTSSTSSTAAAKAGAATGGGTVITASSTTYGTILADSSGRTLYMLTADTPTKSICTGACPPIWPPLTVTGSPTAGSGVKASLLGTITRSDGSHQVTYNGHPLYTFVKDSAPGQVNGEGINHFGGIWYVLNAAGDPVTGPIAAGGANGTTTTSVNLSYG